MERLATDIPIYKIYHIRSPDVIQREEYKAGQSASLSPVYNVLYVFYGNVEFMSDEGRVIDINDVFVEEPTNPHFQKIFSEYELYVIQQNEMKVVFLPERIYPDDSIETIKKKFLYLTRDKLALSYAELYFFCKQAKHVNTQLAYDQITSNGKLEMTPVRVQNYLLNIDNHSKSAKPLPSAAPSAVPSAGQAASDAAHVGVAPEYMKLGSPDNGIFTYTNIANLKLEEKPRIMNVALGQELNIVSSFEYPYTINPFDALSADPFLEIHAGEIVNTTNKTVLIDYGVFIDNTIYLVTAEDVLQYTKEMINIDVVPTNQEGAASDKTATAARRVSQFGKPVYESYMVPLYYPYLSVFRDESPRSVLEKGSAEAAGETDISTIHSHNTLKLHQSKLFESDKKILNENFMRQTANIKLLYDIYERRTSEHNYLDNGIRGVEFMIHPETPYNQSLDAVFKLIHCSDSIPYIKHNPGKKRDNIYKLFISGISRSGRKIPYLPKGDIFRLIKTTARKKSVAIYINYIYSNPDIPDHKATHLAIPVVCEFYPDGSIYVKLFTKYSFTIKEIEEIIIATVNPVLRVIKEHVEQGGFQMNLFSRLHHPQIELINLEYFAQIPITRNIEIKQMIRCISSAFNEVEGSLKKGIVLRYKRVSNYNDMSSQDAYIIEMMNKCQSDRDIIDGLRDNYGLSDQDARSKLSMFLSSLQTQQYSRYRGGNIRIKNNPGFLTKITKGAFNNIITVEITNINNILYLTPLHAYIDSIIRIYQNPSTTDIPYEKITELCTNTTIRASSTATVKAKAKTQEKEDTIDVMEEIVPAPKKPSAGTSSGPAGSGSAAMVVEPIFGFEIEKNPEKDEEIDLFELLQDDDEDNNEDDVAEEAGNRKKGGGGGGGGGGVAAVPRQEPVEPEEDISDITGMELANPNPFSKRIQERDPVIHLNEDAGKFNAYSRSCPWNVRRQPVILTDEEKERIDREHPGSYSHSITYGSDASKQYHYICPRYWSLKDNTSLTEEEVKSGKYGAIIPQKAKKIPRGANIFEFTDDKYHIDEKGNYKQHYPGFLKKDAHPKGLCVPCCFAQWDKPAQTARRNECEAKKHEEIRIETTKEVAPTKPSDAALPEKTTIPATELSSSIKEPTIPRTAPPPPSEIVKLNEMKDERILSADKFPLENNRLGYLPTQLQKFLFTDSRNCQVSLKNASIKKDTPCLIRRGVETNDRQSFVSAVAYYYKESLSTEKSTARIVDVDASTVTPAKNPPHVVSNILEPIAISSDTTKDDILKRVTQTIQKNAKILSKHSAFPGGGGPAEDVAVIMPHTTSQNEYESEDEVPVVMTPRTSSGPVSTMASMPRPLTTSLTVKRGKTYDRDNDNDKDNDRIPTIREMRTLIIQSLDVDMFVTLQNGTLVDSFYNPSKELREEDMIRNYSASKISRTLPKTTFVRICNAYENFVAYLDDDTSIIDHTYLWDIICRPNEKLFKHGNNIILLHIPDDDITNNVQVICPTNAYSGEVFDINRKTIIIMKRDVYYEPIYLFESKSNGKFNILGRFALKSKTLMPKIKHVIESVRDIYFSYCRLHASQPREYKYKMNMPAHVIAKMLRDAGFNIDAQVMNFNGKVVGLQISQVISKLVKIDPSAITKKQYNRKTWKGVIPTAPSAPLVQHAVSPNMSDTQNNTPPMIFMNEDELWQMSYHETVDFLKEVAQHVYKITKKDVYCLPKVKVVEDGLIVGVITETNQFIQVNIEKDPQLNQMDELPTVTESNHLIADEVVSNTPKEQSEDKNRDRYVRNIRLETNFYNVFRNTARNVFNRPENKAIKDEIERMVASPFIVYTNKLSQIIIRLKKMLSKHVSFIRYRKNTLKMVGEISGCITSDDSTCGQKSYCLKEFGGMCKLLLPQHNLMFPEIDNEIAYFGKLADEIIRYERVKLFMFEPTKYLSFQDIKYNLRENEIILLETFITQEYFENMEPADANPYIHQTNFYTVAPSSLGTHGVQQYDPVYQKEYVDRYLEIESGVKRGLRPEPSSKNTESITSGLNVGSTILEKHSESLDINEINHVLDFCQEVSKRKVTIKLRNTFFPKMNTFEILFSNESKECSFDIILTILRTVAQIASKCPSGHSCIRNSGEFAVAGGITSSASLSESESESKSKSELCDRCRSNIGYGEGNFACRQCNYFMCDNCRFQHVDELANITVTRIKDILVTEYTKLSALGLDKKLTMILNGYGMKQYADIINEGRATLAQIIQSENYFFTNIDLWLLAVYFKIPMIFVSQTLLSENGKNYMVLYGDEMTESYFFIQPFQIIQDVPSRFGLMEVKLDETTSLLKIPLQYVSPELEKNIRKDDDTRIHLEEYIRTFKLLNIKKKKRVFTMLNKQNK
jgi:hypothetical protein